MLFTSIISLALALGASAMPARRADPANTRFVQLRLYGEPSCSAQNLGELGVYGDSVNKCQTFGTDTIRSVSFEYKYADNCTRELSPSLALGFHKLIVFQSLSTMM